MKDTEKLIEKAFLKNGGNLRKFTKETIKTRHTPTEVAYTLRGLFAVSASARNQAATIVAKLVFDEEVATIQKIEAAKTAPTVRKFMDENYKKYKIRKDLQDKLNSAINNTPSDKLRDLLRLSPSGIAAALLPGCSIDIFSPYEKKNLSAEIDRALASRNNAENLKKWYQETETNKEKAATLDRIIDMLDHLKVGNKILGDCTKPDLLRAAVAAEQAAGEITVQAGFYRLLADLIPVGETVRTASDRGKIVALLTHQFRECGL